MRLVNRTAVVLKPKEAFVEWVKELGDGPPGNISVERLRDFCHTYLIPELPHTTDHERYVRKISRDLFEAELWSWRQDEEVWPAKRDWRTFKKWFDIEIHGMVIDVANEPIEEEDM